MFRLEGCLGLKVPNMIANLGSQNIEYKTSILGTSGVRRMAVGHQSNSAEYA